MRRSDVTRLDRIEQALHAASSESDLAQILEAGRRKSLVDRRSPAELAADFAAEADALEATLPDRVGSDRRLARDIVNAKRRLAAHYDQLSKETP